MTLLPSRTDRVALKQRCSGTIYEVSKTRFFQFVQMLNGGGHLMKRRGYGGNSVDQRSDT